MSAAPVGVDQYGEDPSVSAMQDHVAALLGKDAAPWLPSGTMAYQARPAAGSCAAAARRAPIAFALKFGRIDRRRGNADCRHRAADNGTNDRTKRWRRR